MRSLTYVGLLLIVFAVTCYTEPSCHLFAPHYVDVGPDEIDLNFAIKVEIATLAVSCAMVFFRLWFMAIPMFWSFWWWTVHSGAKSVNDVVVEPHCFESQFKFLLIVFAFCLVISLIEFWLRPASRH
jgi:hypothetical protein